MSTYKPIQDYAIIGNRRSAALVAKDGTIDWAPAPFLDSPSVFAAILDYTKGGFWAIQPTEQFTSEQEYVPETNVLVTRFTTQRGIVEVIDWLPIRHNGNGKDLGTFHIGSNGVQHTLPEEEETLEIQRKIVCTSGACSVKVFFQPRFNYARGKTSLSVVEKGVVVVNGNMKGVLIADLDFYIEEVDAHVEPQDRAVAEVELQQGQQQYLEFRYNVAEVTRKSDEEYEHDLVGTKQFWMDWVHRCDLETCSIEYPWHEAVMRSSLVLKILFLEPPGSIAAAATTSLPEEIGSGRNWDYRFSWVRDSAFTLQALFWLGYIKEADEYVRWLMHECRSIDKDGPEDLQIMYGLRGQKELTEETLDHLDGYMGSKPVRIGNGAYNQRQWDIYGGMLNMMWRLHKMRPDYEMSPEIWAALRSFANFVVDVWREPDEGLWEVRGEQLHFVHSKVMCWVALDRAIKLAEAYGLEGDLDIWKEERKSIKIEVVEKGWSEERQAFVQSFGSEDVDAAVLLMPVLGFIEGDHPKMVSTIVTIEKELSLGDGLFRRYTNSPQDGMSGGEGAFLLCSFWMVDALLLAGQKEKAQALFEKLLTYRNHVGLYAEEIDPSTKDFLGNFPQAYTHIGLINSAFYLSFDPKTLRTIVS